MILGLDEKYSIFLIGLLFFFIIIVSFYISTTDKTVLEMPPDYLSRFENETAEKEIDDCVLCGDYSTSLIEMINQRIEKSGISEYLSQDFSEAISIGDLPQLKREGQSNCTGIFNFTEIIKYDRSYKYSFSDSNEFFVSEKYKEKINQFYVIETVSKIHFGFDTYTTIMNSYYLDDGTCVQSEYTNDHLDGFNTLGCSGNYNLYLCEELIENLNFDGEEKYFVYGKNYDVYVYSNDNNTFILKFGKEVPILFYLYEGNDDSNKYLQIELLSVERGKI